MAVAPSGEYQSSLYLSLKALKPPKNTGLDGIGPRFLKDGADALDDVVTYLVNMSITSGMKIVPPALNMQMLFLCIRRRVS